jgi:phosphate transport system substrate-binding protein
VDGQRNRSDRNSVSGTHEFFREMVLYNGDYKPEVEPQPGSEAVVQNAANEQFEIGCSGLCYRVWAPFQESTFSGIYLIAQYLNIYLNKKPDQALDPLRPTKRTIGVPLRPDRSGKRSD